MKKKTDIPRNEVHLSSISPFELWERLGLAQPREEKELNPDVFSPDFLDEENLAAFEAFRKDCPFDVDDQDSGFFGSISDVVSSDKGGLFLWALLNEYSKRLEKKLSSINVVFKDELYESITQVGDRYGIDFEEEDLDRVCRFLSKKGLIRSSRDSIRITRRLSKLFHEKFQAWLAFWLAIEIKNQRVLSSDFFKNSNNIFYQIHLIFQLRIWA